MWLHWQCPIPCAEQSTFTLRRSTCVFSWKSGSLVPPARKEFMSRSRAQSMKRVHLWWWAVILPFILTVIPFFTFLCYLVIQFLSVS